VKMKKILKIGWEKFARIFPLSSSGGVKACKTTCLRKISYGNSDNKVADIVFVHGLDGNAAGTWTNSNGFCWPEELGKESNNVDIWLLGYNASPTGQTLALPSLAANIVAHLQNAKLGSYPIVFVCHSLGGLLVKQILRNCSDRQDEAHSLFNSTKGIIFLATPHAGTLWVAMSKKISVICGSLLFKALDWNDPHLNDLNLWFRDSFKGEVTVYFETLPTAAGIIVVDQNSSDPGMPSVRPVPIEANHVEICKPKDTSGLVYANSKRFIKQVVVDKKVEAKLLAKELLHSICKSSLLAYQKELFLLDSTKWISRPISKQIRSSVCDQRKSIQFLVGESGFGKSTLAFQILKEHIEAGGYGFWLPANVVRESHTVKNAIIKVVTSFCPTLSLDSICDHFEDISSTNKLLLVVDDINQDRDSMKVAHKLLSWAASVKTDEEKEVLATNIIMCPVWPQLWNGLEMLTKGKQWIENIFIDLFDDTEGAEALLSSDNKLTSRGEAEIIARELGNDPILIALFSSIHNDASENSLDLLAENVIDSYINHCILKIVAVEQSFLANEYHQALLNLSICMIQNKNMHPTWNEIIEWVEPNKKSIEIVRSLIRTNFLCRLNSEDKVVFRHDRIRNVILVKGMIHLFQAKKDIDDVLAEPYYSELIAHALIKNSDFEMLEKIKMMNILALVDALRLFGIAKTDFQQSIVRNISNWLKEHKPIPSSLFHAICLSLVETDSPSVLDITRDLPEGHLVWLARLRNGCAVSGVKYCTSGFGPTFSISDKLRDRIIDHSKRRHQDELIRQLKLLINDTKATDDVREGVLSFSGFMSSEELSEYILPYWRSAVDKQRLLPEAIWAGIQCSGLKPEIVLNELFDFWATLPEKSDEKNWRSPRNEVAEALRFSFRYGIDENTLDYLCEQQKKVGNLKWALAYMLEQVDSPRTMEMIVKTAADILRKIKETNGFSPWVTMLTDNWNGRRGECRRLSDKSFTALYTIWTNTTDKHVQEIAFRLWLTRVEKEHIDILREISPTAGIYRTSLWKRAQLEDVTVMPDFLVVLKEESHWCYVAHHIWNPEIMGVVKQHILSFECDIPKDFSGGRLNPHYEVSELLTKIPVQDAETLLVDHWNILGYSPRFVQAALYLSTKKSLDLAAVSIKQCPPEVNLFEHIGMFFGFMSERRNFLTQTKLNSLIPYIDRLSERDLGEAMEACARLGMPEWGKEHVVNLSENYRRRYNPSDGDLMKDLDDFVNDQHGIWRVDHWLEDFNHRNDSHKRALRIIDRWLENSKLDSKSFKLAATVLESVGSRKHINILHNRHPLNISASRLNAIIEDATFAIMKRTLE